MACGSYNLSGLTKCRLKILQQLSMYQVVQTDLARIWGCKCPLNGHDAFVHTVHAFCFWGVTRLSGFKRWNIMVLCYVGNERGNSFRSVRDNWTASLSWNPWWLCVQKEGSLLGLGAGVSLVPIRPEARGSVCLHRQNVPQERGGRPQRLHNTGLRNREYQLQYKSFWSTSYPPFPLSW